MTSMVTGGLFNAIAFAGAGFLFSKLNRSGYEKETKRHNLALEQLSRAKEKWYEKEVSRKNRIEEKRQQLADANADTNKALSNLKSVLSYQISKLELTQHEEPKLSNYYEPSDEMEEYKLLATAAIGLGGGFVGHKVYSFIKKKKNG